MSTRLGASVVEAMVALVLGLFVVHLALTTVQRLDGVRDRMERRQEALLSSRIARTVLRGELARSDGVWTIGRDSLRVRSFRGTGVVCSTGPAADALVVAYRGDRYGDPRKDSVELVDADGVRTVLELRSSEPATAGCPRALPGEEGRAWTLEGVVPRKVVLARIFESGSYHLVASALRYRIGRGGRQPLTPDVWEDDRTAFSQVDSALVLELGPRPGYGSGRSAFLWWLHR